MNNGNEPVWNKVKTGSSASEHPASAERILPPQRPAHPATPAAAGIPYWQMAWRHRFLLLGFIALGALVGAAKVTLSTPVYQASATVEVVGLNQQFMNMSQVDPEAGSDTNTASGSN